MLHGDKVYSLPLGENFVQDGFVAQAYRAIHNACANAANSDDGTLQATPMAFYLDLDQLDSQLADRLEEAYRTSFAV